jgi:hypothetical protein
MLISYNSDVEPVPEEVNMGRGFEFSILQAKPVCSPRDREPCFLHILLMPQLGTK